MCLGGVTLFPKENFLKINGFSNEYWGWGAEDDDLRLRCDTMNIKVQRKQGRFHSLPHDTIQYEDRPQKSPGYIENLNRLNNFQNMNDTTRRETIKNDGLSNTNNYFRLIDTIVYNKFAFIKTQV